MIQSDRSAFLLEFGETVVWTPTGGSPASLTAIFTKETSEEAVGEDQYLMPVLEADCLSSSVEGVKIGDSLKVRTVTYRVISILPDDDGWTTLKLSENTP